MARYARTHRHHPYAAPDRARGPHADPSAGIVLVAVGGGAMIGVLFAVMRTLLGG